MRIFDIKEAAYYCSGYIPHTGLAAGSLHSFVTDILQRRVSSIKEGTTTFDEFRSCSLRNAERSLFLAASHYRRCLDLMVPSASSWAFVTIYYGSWHAAHALLGMFGCTIYKSVVDVSRSAPGGQELSIRRIGPRPGQESSTYSGSHRQFWDFFYREVTSLRPLVPSHLTLALTPVSSDPMWQITQRNQINYDTYEAIQLSQDFDSVFSRAGFPASLPGVLATQYGVFEALLELSFSYAQQFGLLTDALSNLGMASDRGTKIRDMIYGAKVPALVRKTKKNVLLHS